MLPASAASRLPIAFYSHPLSPSPPWHGPTLLTLALHIPSTLTPRVAFLQSWSDAVPSEVLNHHSVECRAHTSPTGLHIFVHRVEHTRSTSSSTVSSTHSPHLLRSVEHTRSTLPSTLWAHTLHVFILCVECRAHSLRICSAVSSTHAPRPPCEHTRSTSASWVSSTHTLHVFIHSVEHTSSTSSSTVRAHTLHVHRVSTHVSDRSPHLHPRPFV